MKQQPRTSRHHQRGVTLIEGIVFLIIGIVVLAAAAAGISKIFGTNEISEETSNIANLITNTKVLRSAGSYGTTGDDLIPQLVATNGIPKGMTVNGGALSNNWGGAVSVDSTGGGFTITYASPMPQEACIQLAEKISRGGAVRTTINAGAAIAGQVSTAAATTACLDTGNNTLVFTADS